jgi:hypothetical protein
MSRRLGIALKRAEAITGNPTFTWHGTEVPCTPSTLRRGQPIEVGGHTAEVTMTLYVRRDQYFTVDSTLTSVNGDLWFGITTDTHKPRPVAGRKLVFQGREYRILSAREPSPRSHYELELGDSR